MKKWIFVFILSSYFNCIFFASYAKDEKGVDFVNEEGEGLLNEVPHLSKLTVLSNLNIPKAVFTTIVDGYGSPSNMKFLVNFYRIIYQINKQEKLDLSNFGHQQNIDLVVAGTIEEIEKLEDNIEKAIKKNDSLIYLKSIRTDYIFNYKQGLSDRWFQDWGEFVGYAIKKGQLTHGMYYVNRDRGLKEIVQEIAKMLDLPFIYSDSTSGTPGDYGGNIDATPDGIIFYGNTMDNSQSEQIEALGNDGKTVSLNTSWLSVGHVDEMFSIIPSVNQCQYPSDYEGPKINYAIVAADPLYGLNIIKNSLEKDWSRSFISPSSPDERTKNIYYIELLKQALSHFLINQNQNVSLKNIDEQGLEICTKNEQMTDYCHFINFNIKSKKIIERNIKKLTQKTLCQSNRVVRVPQLYRERYWSGGVSFFPGTANMVVLRNYLIVPQINYEPFSKEVYKILNKEVGGNKDNSKVFFIDEQKEYHDLMGEIHCATNIFREIDLFLKDFQS